MPPVKLSEKIPIKGMPRELLTIGDHLKLAQINRNELLMEQAGKIGIAYPTLSRIQIGKGSIMPETFGKIISYLDYCPLVFKTDTFGGKMKASRLNMGLGLWSIHKKTGIQPVDWTLWEKDDNLKKACLQEKIESFIFG